MAKKFDVNTASINELVTRGKSDLGAVATRNKSLQGIIRALVQAEGGRAGLESWADYEISLQKKENERCKKLNKGKTAKSEGYIKPDLTRFDAFRNAVKRVTAQAGHPLMVSMKNGLSVPAGHKPRGASHNSQAGETEAASPSTSHSVNFDALCDDIALFAEVADVAQLKTLASYVAGLIAKKSETKKEAA